MTRLYLIREHRLHGIVTGMEGVKIMSSLDDQLDRLLVSFKDAKVGLQLPDTMLEVHINIIDCSTGMVRICP